MAEHALSAVQMRMQPGKQTNPFSNMPNMFHKLVIFSEITNYHVVLLGCSVLSSDAVFVYPPAYADFGLH